MRIDQLNVTLRARTEWEAMELGTALVRRHARAIWLPLVCVSLPLFALINAAAWWADAFGWAWLLMWWLKPVSDRIALYVMSRGVFGEEPRPLQTLRAQRHWGWRGFWGYLGWRRFSPFRSLLLPVNLLEGSDASQRSVRRRAVLGGTFGHAVLLTFMCMVFELVIVSGCIAAIFLFVPLELLSDSWRAAWDMVRQDMPAWAKLGVNFLFWLAATLIGPFYAGAGFALYLNRRTEMEAWDVEIAFRRLRERLQQAAPLLVLALVLCWPMGALHAQSSDPAPSCGTPDGFHEDADPDADADDEGIPEGVPADDPSNTPAVIFGGTPDTAGFRQAVQRAYEDPLVTPTREVSRWERTQSDAEKEKEKRDKDRNKDANPYAKGPRLPAQIAEWLLWGLVGALVLFLLVTSPWWVRWLRGTGARRRRTEGAVVEEAVELPEVIPPDPAARARDLWQQGRPRQALALLYRASVESMSERAGVVLPPGATESQCLRASRRMPDEADRVLFARVVRVWQYAAYAGRLPEPDDFESLASTLQAQFRWRA
ncbi:DUF4129 domain-containing protein [uncultured Stenotrophomonas sp.]|uniref:DUF4129 domain-containing protein n=1 Tax=uncultured Stenotrophomonas sp. TaxID=165438 RepID=UPI0028ED4914|nr:DUF4129 domain-containing protein [uncultured Stenotrophomonas sp.]